MDKQVRYIIEDLLPLYNEGLLSEETTRWFEEQVRENEEVKKLVSLSQNPLPKVKVESTLDQEKMFQRINQKLSLYQIIFVALSFFLAINTSMLNENFGFILWYAVLGFVTYVFYKNMKIVFLISFIPIFLWSLGQNISDYVTGNTIEGATFIQFFLPSILGSLLVTVIHYLFAFIGSLIGLLMLKLRERG